MGGSTNPSPVVSYMCVALQARPTIGVKERPPEAMLLLEAEGDWR